MRALAVAFALASAAGPAWAQTVSPAPDGVAVVVYRLGEPAENQHEPAGGSLYDGLALIVETRTVDVPAGPARISFRGVAEGIVPQSAVIEGLPASVLEQNFDFNLLTPGSLLEQSVGRTVRMIRTDRATGRVTETRARIVSAPQGVILQPLDGGAEALRCSGLAERLVFDELPASLADRPTLSIATNAAAAGRHKVRLSYLATGLDWRASYVARIRPDDKSLDLTGWITLANASGTGFVNAPTQVVAGNIEHDEGETRPVDPKITYLGLQCWPVGRGGLRVEAAAPPPPPPAPMMAMRAFDKSAEVEEVIVTSQMIAKQSDLGDYKLYTLPEPTTVAARQTKQVLFLDQPAVPFERYYAVEVRQGNVDGASAWSAARLMLRMRNREADGLGKPMPGGVFAVMQPTAGTGPVLAGEAVLKTDAPIGLPVELELGGAMGVSVQRREAETVERGGKQRTAYEVEIRNAKLGPVRVEVRHRVNAGAEGFRLLRASAKAGKKGADPLWTLTVPAGGSAMLSYTVEYDD